MSGAVPATMKAVALKPNGGGAPESMIIEDAPVPTPEAGEVLIRIHATAVNRADTLQRKGLYPPPPGASTIIGMECAGTIVSSGDDTKSASTTTGKRVMALLAGGGYAQYATVPSTHIMPIPDHLSFEQAAAIPETFLTAYQILVMLGQAKRGEYVLVHAGASGVGTSVIQICKMLGINAIVTAGSAEKIKKCLALGAVFGVNYKELGQTGDFVTPIHDYLRSVMPKTAAGTATDSKAPASAAPTAAVGVDLVLDCIGASYVTHNLNVLKPQDGRWILYGTMGGATVDSSFPLGAILRKRITLQGTTLRNRSIAYKTQLVQLFSDNILPLIRKQQQPAKTGGSGGSGTTTVDDRSSLSIEPIVDVVYPLSEIVAAHKHMEADKNFGKIVISVP